MQHSLRNGLRGLSHRRALSLSSTGSSLHGQRPNPSSSSLPSTRSFAQVSLTRPTVAKLRLNTDSEEKDEHFAHMLMFGKPGAGKGTLTTRLTQKYDILALSTGDLLRQHIAEGTEVGRETEAIIARGELVPDEVVLRVVTSKLDSLQHKVTLSLRATSGSPAHYFIYEALDS
jgi:nucleoside-triphosphate--adenylate kinase